MIICCIKCSKKFEVNSELIPDEGRTVQCGSCSHTWFFNKKNLSQNLDNNFKYKDKTITNSDIDSIDINGSVLSYKDNANLKKEEENIIKDENKKSFGFSFLLSIMLVLIMSFIALLIIIDTFKTPLFIIYPDLEILIFNFFETLKDIKLFIVDLI